ncbi:hypothetical protein [Paraburkholderia diazotrophica]|uniref:hypothetical protein n=1 Tax=Paraburkholderia diazotrophica TaxID=667676 RepID=UPI00317F934B
MGHYIQIGPDVLLAAEILSPAWGREYRQDCTVAPAGRVEPSSARVASAVSEGERDPCEANSGQIKLL